MAKVNPLEELFYDDFIVGKLLMRMIMREGKHIEYDVTDGGFYFMGQHIAESVMKKMQSMGFIQSALLGRYALTPTAVMLMRGVAEVMEEMMKKD